MKKTKKILSLILAIIMIVSTMPMAFAVEFDHEAFIETGVKISAYCNNMYTSDESTTSAEKFNANSWYALLLFANLLSTYPELESSNAATEPEILKTMPEAANAYLLALQEGVVYFESLIADGTYVIQVDASKYAEAYTRTTTTFGLSKVDNLVAKTPANLKAEADAAKETYYAAINNNTDNYTQDDFERDIEPFTTYWTQVYDCLNGNHVISNNIATNNGDGTHTFICAFCTDTATVKHSYTDGKCVCDADEPMVDNCLNGIHLYGDFVKDNDKTHTKTCVLCSVTQTLTHSYTDGKCICGADAPMVEEDKDDTTEETPDDNTNTDTETDNDDTEPQRTSLLKQLLQKLSDFFKNLFAKLFGWMKK